MRKIEFKNDLIEMENINGISICYYQHGVCIVVSVGGVSIEIVKWENM
jgi:hypothetical protein